jgi:hypothetical protein
MKYYILFWDERCYLLFKVSGGSWRLYCEVDESGL